MIFTYTQIAQLVLQYGPGVLDLVEKLIANIESNKVPTSADIAALKVYGSKTSAQYLAEAQAGTAAPISVP